MDAFLTKGGVSGVKARDEPMCFFESMSMRPAKAPTNGNLPGNKDEPRKRASKGELRMRGKSKATRIQEGGGYVSFVVSVRRGCWEQKDLTSD